MALRKGLSNRPNNATMKVATLPPAQGGMDGRVTLSDSNPMVAIYTYNLLADEYGMKVRSGYAEHCIDLDKDEGNLTGLKTLIPFESASGNPDDDRLFAVTNEGIWDVSTYNNPTLKVSFSTVTGKAGDGVFTQYNTDAAEQLIFFADSENGLFTFDADADTWAQTTDFTGLTAASVSFIMVHKQRVWMVKKNSGDSYYLNIGAIAGQATKFQFGNKFKHGGSLVGLYNWTIDGGTGVDDYLVGISTAGDVIPYQGEDPEATGSGEWEQRGVYFVGAVAGGANCASEFGGDLNILSAFGVTPLSTLIKGVDVTLAVEGLGAKTAYYLRADIRSDIDGIGWGIHFLPSQGNTVISTPRKGNGTFIQYAYDINRDTFGWWRGVPAICFAEWRNIPYFGTLDGKVMSMNADLDDRRITPVNVSNGLAIDFSSLFAFSALESGGLFKRGGMIRPDFVSQNKLVFQAKFAYDYEITKFASTLTLMEQRAGRWNNGVWDEAVWGSTKIVNRTVNIGGVGLGRRMAVAVQGSASSSTYLMSYDVMWNVGGML